MHVYRLNNDRSQFIDIVLPDILSKCIKQYRMYDMTYSTHPLRDGPVSCFRCRYLQNSSVIPVLSARSGLKSKSVIVILGDENEVPKNKTNTLTISRQICREKIRTNRYKHFGCDLCPSLDTSLSVDEGRKFLLLDPHPT